MCQNSHVWWARRWKWGFGGLPPEQFLGAASSRTSENVLFAQQPIVVFIVDLHAKEKLIPQPRNTNVSFLLLYAHTPMLEAKQSPVSRSSKRQSIAQASGICCMEYTQKVTVPYYLCSGSANPRTEAPAFYSQSCKQKFLENLCQDWKRLRVCHTTKLW